MALRRRDIFHDGKIVSLWASLALGTMSGSAACCSKLGTVGDAGAYLYFGERGSGMRVNQNMESQFVPCTVNELTFRYFHASHIT